jgi:hypothetical protein
VAMGGHDLAVATAENYRAFAAEAKGRSPQYEALAGEVAGDAGLLRFLDSLPKPKRQPNLLFAAASYLLGEPPDITALRDLLARRGADLAAVMMGHRTQTNEPARCATLLPALAQLRPPLALIEVGASAGLTLLADRYSYDYVGGFGDSGSHRVAGLDAAAPTIRCAVGGPASLPSQVPEVVWRAGLDLNPLDVTRDDDVRWLSCLVWPGEGDRAERLAAAVATARRDPPPVHRGDLLTDLPALAAQAPADATLVVFHSAVLAYVTAADRPRFTGAVGAVIGGRGGAWLSNEAPRVVPDVPLTGAQVRQAHENAALVLARDGRTPLALADGHGAWLHWLPPGGQQPGPFTSPPADRRR